VNVRHVKRFVAHWVCERAIYFFNTMRAEVLQCERGKGSYDNKFRFLVITSA